jgi:Response regulator containing CheY-like receiver, AAA-type ATPase, and DNA-binding domains
MSKILVVDDERFIRDNLVYALTAEKYTVSEAADGKIALNILKHEKPDLIITDILMPEMDGITFIKTLKKNKELNAIPVIVISSVPFSSVKEKLARHFINEFIAKPFSLSILFSVVEKILENNQK